MELLAIAIDKPEDTNFILGQSHFIKTVEDLHEALVGAVPGIRFGLAFCEASGKRLVRTSGTDEKLVELAARNAQTIGAGHSFIIVLGDGFFPVNVLNTVKAVPEVCRIFCANATQTQVLVENCIIQNFSQKGIDVALTSGGGNLAVRNTTISNAATGISLASTSSFAFGTVSNSTISFSSAAAVAVNGGILNAESDIFSHNSTAILPTAGVVRLSNSDIFNNAVGTDTGVGINGTVVSANNNRKAGNGAGFADASITTF